LEVCPAGFEAGGVHVGEVVGRHVK
jgi:hypothetical protein